MFFNIIKRDFKLAMRSGGTWAYGLVFFVLFISLCAIALGGEINALHPLAPALIWLAIILSLLLSFETVFAVDAADGTLEHYKLSGQSMMSYVLAKSTLQWLLSILPLLLALPLVGLFLGLSTQDVLAIALSVLLASPALVIYSAFSAACLVGNRSGGILMVILSVPILVPLMIFGINAARTTGFCIEFQAVLGITLIAIAIGIPAINATLNTYTE